jgi:hypothetical protein
MTSNFTKTNVTYTDESGAYFFIPYNQTAMMQTVGLLD